MCELRLFDYQREVVKSKEKEIICNWSRGLGKDYTLVCKILNDRPDKVFWVGSFNSIIERFEDALEANDIEAKVSYTDGCRSEVIVKFVDGSKDILVQRYFEGVSLTVDLLVFNETLPHYVKNIVPKQIVSMITVNNYNGNLQRLFPNVKINEQGVDTMLKSNLWSMDMLKKEKNSSDYYFDEFDILSVPKNITIKGAGNSRLEEVMRFYDNGVNDKFLIQTLANLQTEYDIIAPSKDNVLTRQNLLKMIMEVQRSFRM